MMLRQLLLPVPIIVFLIGQSASVESHCSDWGFYGHRLINRMAVFCLPEEMLEFYKANIEYIEAAAVNADKRRYAVASEAPRHYIDLDHYGVPPFDSLPRGLGDALYKLCDLEGITTSGDTVGLGEISELDRRRVSHLLIRAFMQDDWLIEVDSSVSQLFAIAPDSIAMIAISNEFTTHGILPYHLPHIQSRLTRAMLNGDRKMTLSLSADIGHYIADAHVPLHTTSNYDGQLTGQKGLHAFWESRIPELLANGYEFWVGQAQYIQDPETYYWSIVLSSHQLVDSVLQQADAAEMDIRSDRRFSYEVRGQQLLHTQSPEYIRCYSEALGGMVERRMRSAVRAVASAWYSAWIDAGRPDLTENDVSHEYPVEVDSSRVDSIKGIRGHR